jgi:hypothetical protein
MACARVFHVNTIYYREFAEHVKSSIMISMNKKALVLVIFAVAIVLGLYALLEKRGTPATPAPVALDPLNATYTVEGRSVTLVNGKSEAPAAPGSATMVTTSVFGQPASGDINGDGKPDAALILVQNSGGSGTFYYAAVAINTPGGAQGTNAVLLGDRIAPQNILIQNGTVVANYADRKPGEPMTAQPSVGISAYMTFDGSMLRSTPLTAGPGEHCGGNMTTALSCGSGYHCASAPGSHGPVGDIGGICVKN